MMRNVRLAILLISGCSFILLAVFAFNFGLDPDPAWGKSRALALFLGILSLAAFADIRFGPAWTENLKAQLIAIHKKTLDHLHVPETFTGTNERLRSKPVQGLVILVFWVTFSVHVWFASAGTWATLPPASNYYDILADAFAHGRVSLALEVPSQLLALPNPYDFASRDGIEYLWDAILYKGNYYLYWGPMPAVIIAAIKLVHPLEVGDHIIVFCSAAGLTLFQTLLLTRIWMRSFHRLPAWTLLLGVFLAGLAAPVDWMIHRSNIYEASILSAQAFLMGGVYFAYLALDGKKTSPGWLALASIFWAGAIASRTIVALVIVFLLFLILLVVFRQHGWIWTPRLGVPLLAIGLPIIAAAVLLGGYNAVRFGSVFDFGLDYMLTSHNNRQFKGGFFSSQYVPANAYNYLLNPPERIRPFPYFRAKAGKETGVFGSSVPEPYYAEKVTGLIYILPFAVFAVVPALQMAVTRIRRRQGAQDLGQPLDWIVPALSGATLIAAGYILVYYYGTMRYLADVTPMLVALAVLGFWIGYQAVESDRLLWLVYAGAGILLAGVSIVVTAMLALLSSQRINMYSPHVLPALDKLFKSIFSG